MRIIRGWNDGAARIAKERIRQIEGEGFSAAHDQKHTCGELAKAAACYAAPNPIFELVTFQDRRSERPGYLFADPWPWAPGWDKRPHEGTPGRHRIELLTKAGALIAAEIDRLLALEPEPPEPKAGA